MTNTNDLTTQIEGDLIAMLDEFHSLPEVWDNELDEQIAKWYSNPPKVWPKRDLPYFSPSWATKCPREIFYRKQGAPKDIHPKPPHQTRWQRIGTVIGDMVQRELLSIERNFEKHTGNKPKFVFERNPNGTPMFEDFAGKNYLVEHNGEKFYLYGKPDGIMRYVTDDGEIIRVGLEIKSKQESPSKTSVRSMKQAGYAHEIQTNLYALMYDVDYYVILYQNASKRKWDMTEEEYKDFPDVRAFCRKISEYHREPTLDRLAQVTKALREGVPPKLDLDGWKFNEYKTHIAKNISEEELEELRRVVDQARKSSMPQWKINSYIQAVDQIEGIREGGK